MPVTDVQQDFDKLTLTITADFAAPVERVWQVYADPRQLEKAGLLTKRRNGREQLASGDVEAVRSVASMLTELEQVWRGRIARIDELLASDP